MVKLLYYCIAEIHLLHSQMFKSNLDEEHQSRCYKQPDVGLPTVSPSLAFSGPTVSPTAVITTRENLHDCNLGMLDCLEKQRGPAGSGAYRYVTS